MPGQCSENQVLGTLLVPGEAELAGIHPAARRPQESTRARSILADRDMKYNAILEYLTPAES